jgi:hypothetical protein
MVYNAPRNRSQKEETVPNLSSLRLPGLFLIHPLVLVSFAYAFHTVALYPLLKFVIALPLCFLISSFIRKIPLADRIL